MYGQFEDIFTVLHTKFKKTVDCNIVEASFPKPGFEAIRNLMIYYWEFV
jgi:hypothetical protein